MTPSVIPDLTISSSAPFNENTPSDWLIAMPKA